MKIEQGQTIVVKVAAGKYIKELKITRERIDRLAVRFAYNKVLLNEIKNMEGAKWHGFDEKPRKVWTIKDSPRNIFRLNYLRYRALPKVERLNDPKSNPYYNYDKEIVKHSYQRPLFIHQCEVSDFCLARHYCLIAGDMGIGKTLIAIEVTERADAKGVIWYVGPKAGVIAVSRELEKWNCTTEWHMMTYEGLVGLMKNWEPGDPAPQMLILDESSKVKNKSSQRSQATLHIANAVRDEWGDDGYVIEMSGTPSPKAPTDWWHQCEVACPGFLIEGTDFKLKKRMCLTEMRTSVTGGEYPHIITWLDDENKCAVCGQFDGPEHPMDHMFVRSINEVAKLHKRMQGLVVVKMSKDCLDLPELIYQEVKIKSTPEILRVAKTIRSTARTGAQGLNLLRELSDGFQYYMKQIGEEECPSCYGACQNEQMIPNDDARDKPTADLTEADFTLKMMPCSYCGGAGKVAKYERNVTILETPKDEYFINDLDVHSEIGRYIVWAGYTGSVDRLIGIAHQQGWATLCVDGRGYRALSASEEVCDKDDFLDAMDTSNKRYDELRELYPRICFVGHPKAGGMALTLTASRVSLFFSNCFDGEARMQAVKRAHRAGMLDRAHTIVDLIHLPTDKLVLDNLENKTRLQNITLGELDGCFKTD